MKNYNKIFIFILIMVLLVLGQKYKALKSENEELTGLVDEYDYSLAMANGNIEEANSIIEDAQGYAWATYYEMGDALDNLTTVDTVDRP